MSADLGILLDGARVTVLVVRDPGYCGSCGREGLTALLVGRAEKGANRRWVVARRMNQTSYVTHACPPACPPQQPKVA